MFSLSAGLAPNFARLQADMHISLHNVLNQSQWNRIFLNNVNCVTGKPTFCICKNKDADQRLCFCYITSTFPVLLKSKIFMGCAAWFVLDLVGNQKDAHIAAYLKILVLGNPLVVYKLLGILLQ